MLLGIHGNSIYGVDGIQPQPQVPAEESMAFYRPIPMQRRRRSAVVQQVHPSPVELEADSLGLSSEAELEKVEEHLLICEWCQNELVLTNQYIRVMSSPHLIADRKAAPVNAQHRRRSNIRTDATSEPIAKG
jgi:hypothetical protein